MYILGISADHTSSAALLKDDRVIVCVSEERFNRVKGFFGIPKKSIEFCLEFAGIDEKSIDLVVVASQTTPPSPDWGFEDKKSINLYKLLKSGYSFLIDEIEWRLPILRSMNEFNYSLVSKAMRSSINKERVKKFQEIVAVSEDKFIFLDHHQNHALTGLYGAPFLMDGVKELLVFTADGEGDGLSATVSVYKNGTLTRIGKTSQNNSVGNFYNAVTKFLGMKPNEHEYKVMGLAPYASTKDTQRTFELIKNWIIVDKKNLCFKTIVNSHQFLKLFHLNLSERRFDHIAAGAQKLLEERMLELIHAAIKKTGIKTVIASGGVFMNVKMNKLICEQKEVDKLFVFPSCGDESNAFGACYFGYQLKQKTASVSLRMNASETTALAVKLRRNRDRTVAELHKTLNRNGIPHPIGDLYLGPQFSDKEMSKLIRNLKGVKINVPKNIEHEIALLLSKGEIVARFSDRSEWGARALGNRSILADPSNIRVIEEINKMIKNRDFWMPFAPIILDEDKNRYLKYLHNSNGYYMMMAYDTKDVYRDEMVAAIHPYDKTARAQILLKEFNPKLWEIVNHFKKMTGRGVLLNTSFNIHGEPIVGSPKDALDVFKRSGLKYLALGSFLIAKS